MNLHLRPMISAMLRNRTGPMLVAVQVAIALAVLVNAVCIVAQRIENLTQPTGMALDSIFAVASQGFAQRYDHSATLREDLAYLRGLPGVQAAAPMNAVPMSGDGLATVLSTTPAPSAHTVRANYFETDHQALSALGLRLVAGRNFREDEVLPVKAGAALETSVAQIIVTQSLAHALFPHGSALGQTVYDSLNVLSKPATIIGIVERMQGSWLDSRQSGQVFLIPRTPYPYDNTVSYLVRTTPAERDRLMRETEEALGLSNTARVVLWSRPLEYFKDRSDATDRNMSVVLAIVTVLLLGVAALGVYGLATYNVSIRRKQIGTRRALGARRFDIVSYFLIENWLITTAGLVAGCALAIATGYTLTLYYGLPRLDPYFLVAGILTLWTLGELSVWLPAKRAATISPVVATRTI